MKEEEWFCNKVKECETSLYRLAFSILQNEEDAKDAVQETIFIGYKNIKNLHNREKFKQWMMQIVANTSYSMYNKRKKYMTIESFLKTEQDRRKENIDYIELWEVINKLNQDLRNVIILFYCDELTIKEISRILNISQGAVKTRLSRAREKIKVLLQGDDEKTWK